MVQRKNESNTSIDYNRCPIPKTHRRLVEAHVLWHQALEEYQQPELFQANLNATIQALRNVTFILQSEKHSFSDFEDWYEPWQERMKVDPVLKWLKDARNVVVKQGELETNSTAVVKLVTWRDYVLVEFSVPPGAPPSLILRNLPLLELINNTHLSSGDLKSAAIVIERRWSVPDLDGREILEALAQAYGLLSDVVLDAHIRIGETTCVPSDGTHTHFRSTHHRTGILACMALGVEHRTHSFELSTGQQIELVRMNSPAAPEPRIAATRYGFGKTDQIAKWQEGDPVLIAERLLHAAKRMLRKDKVVIRIVFIRDGGGTWHDTVLNASNRMEKHLLMRMVARFIESVGGDAIIDISEVWMLQPKEVAPNMDIDRVHDTTGQGEALQVLVATREGILRTYTTPFTRGPFGGIKLGDTVRSEKDRLYYLEPVFDVWRRQGVVRLPDGKLRRRLWEPDPLDTCFCGGPRRFGECCKRLLDTVSRSADMKQEVDSAIKVRDFVRTEELARASLAQYVIWVKQHTTPTMHVAPDLHRKFVEVDVPALDAHVRQLRDALVGNGRAESFLPQLHHISRVIGVPELSIRLTALAAEWLFAMGDYLGAVKELETLGDVERLSDTLALVLATRLLDLSAHKQKQYLNRAASGASSKEEKWFAGLELVRHLSDSGEWDEALRKVDSVISESMGASSHRGVLAHALSLRWEITKEEEDFWAAKKELETFTDSEYQQHLAIILIDHGDLDEAERVLSDALNAADLVAQLLIIDARVRANRIDAARELLLKIAPDRVTPRLQYPYAVAYGLVALASEDDELKKLAAANLRRVPSIGNRVTRHVNDFLEALEGNDDARRRAIAVFFRDLFSLRGGRITD